MEKKAKITQCDRVMAWLEKYGNISDREARDELGICRIGARVFDLKKRGIPIVMKMETGVNRFGEKVKYGVYMLVDKGDKHEEKT